jgi:hypothetical protein
LITEGEIGDIFTYHETDDVVCTICSQTNAELSSALEKAELMENYLKWQSNQKCT